MQESPDAFQSPRGGRESGRPVRVLAGGLEQASPAIRWRWSYSGGRFCSAGPSPTSTARLQAGWKGERDDDSIRPQPWPRERDGCSTGPGNSQRTVTEQLAGPIAVLRAEQARRQAGIEVSRPAWKNLVFTGGPGAGRSRAARAVARIYHDLGPRTYGCLIEIAAPDVTGATANETRSLVDEAIKPTGIW